MRIRTELGNFSGSGLALRIDLWPAGFGIETQEYVLIDVRFALDETDRTARTFQEPKIAIAGYIDQTLIELAATFEIHEDWRRDFVIIP